MRRFSLEGKTAVVTGGSRGLGAAIALGLAEAGADVLLTYRERHAEAAAIVQQIEEMGRRARAVPMDVTSRKSVEHAAEQARAFGPVSIASRTATRAATIGATSRQVGTGGSSGVIGRDPLGGGAAKPVVSGRFMAGLLRRPR